MKRKLTLAEIKELKRREHEQNIIWCFNASMFWREHLTFNYTLINVKNLVRSVIEKAKRIRTS